MARGGGLGGLSDACIGNYLNLLAGCRQGHNVELGRLLFADMARLGQVKPSACTLATVLFEQISCRYYVNSIGDKCSVFTQITRRYYVMSSN